VDAGIDAGCNDGSGYRFWRVAPAGKSAVRDGDEALRQIWLTIRLPRVLLALVIGGSLALAGCVMQGLFRNPLADPGLLGISSGAACAVALWVVLPVSLPALMMLYAPMLAAFSARWRQP
jgi:iron complex transport system permease protein